MHARANAYAPADTSPPMLGVSAYIAQKRSWTCDLKTQIESGIHYVTRMIDLKVQSTPLFSEHFNWFDSNFSSRAECGVCTENGKWQLFAERRNRSSEMSKSTASIKTPYRGETPLNPLGVSSWDRFLIDAVYFDISELTLAMFDFDAFEFKRTVLHFRKIERQPSNNTQWRTRLNLMTIQSRRDFLSNYNIDNV